MRIATFNVQNLRLREGPDGVHLDGARDEVLLPSKLSDAEKVLDVSDRALTVQLLAEVNADVLALQEVFDERTLEHFNSAMLAPLGVHYPYRVCISGNDGRRHLAFMSRAPLQDIRSHAALTYEEAGIKPPEGKAGSGRIFSRDCVTAVCGSLVLLNVHFKAPADAESLAVTEREALAVRGIIERRFPDPASAFWLILGDVNVSDVASGDVLEVLTRDFAVDIAASLPASERWTYFHAKSGSYARPDRFLASHALAAMRPIFTMHKEGMSRAATLYDGARLEGVGNVRPRASDHALLRLDLD